MDTVSHCIKTERITPTRELTSALARHARFVGPKTSPSNPLKGRDKQTRLLLIFQAPPVGTALFFCCTITAKFPSHTASTEGLVKDPHFNKSPTSRTQPKAQALMEQAVQMETIISEGKNSCMHRATSR